MPDVWTNINGADKFRIYRINAAGTILETYNFSFNYTALFEIDKGIAARSKLLSGAKLKKHFHIDMLWEINFEGLLDGEDSKLINKLKNAEIDGFGLLLEPHIDCLTSRKFKVQIVEEERRLGLYASWNLSAPNKDYVLLFENTETIERYNWVDPDDVVMVTHVNTESIMFVI